LFLEEGLDGWIVEGLIDVRLSLVDHQVDIFAVIEGLGVVGVGAAERDLFVDEVVNHLADVVLVVAEGDVGITGCLLPDDDHLLLAPLELPDLAVREVSEVEQV